MFIQMWDRDIREMAFKTLLYLKAFEFDIVSVIACQIFGLSSSPFL